jgi:antitoxin protein of toxin-antitoxin system
MGMFNNLKKLDNLKKQATKVVNDHGDQIAKGLDKAGELADRKTKGKHSGQISGGVAKAKNALGKLDGREGDHPDKPQPQPRP